MNTAQRIFKNFLSLTSANIATQVLGVITTAYLARILNPDGFGKINFALAIVSYFAVISHFGLNTIGTREIAQNQEKINDYVNNIVTIKLFLGLLGYFLLVIFVLLINRPSDIKYLLLIYGLTIFTSNTFFFDWVFQGIEKMEYLAVSTLLQGGFYLLFVIYFIESPEQILIIPILLFLSQSVAVFYLISVYSRNVGKKEFKNDISNLKRLLKKSIPIGITAVMTIIIYNTCIISLEFFKTSADVGYYSAVYKVTLLAGQVMAIYSTAVFPRKAEYFKTSLEFFSKLLGYSLKISIIFSLPTMTAIAVLAKPVLGCLYGANYIAAFTALQILACNLFFRSIDIIISQALWAADKQKQVLKIATIQAIIILAGSFILIPPYGIIGASFIFVLHEIVAFFLYYAEIKKIATCRMYPLILKPLIASIFMGCILFILKEQNLIISTAVGILAYLLPLYLMKEIKKEDFEFLLKTGKNHKKP